MNPVRNSKIKYFFKKLNLVKDDYETSNGVKKGFTPHLLREQDKICPVSFRKGAGFTIIEMLVAVAVFSLIVGAASGAFVSGLRAQRRTLAHQELLDQTSYVMEYMSRAIRMARKDMDGTCTGTAKLNYAFVGQCLKFRNYKDGCQEFCLAGSRLEDENGNYLTSDGLQVSSFNVNLVGESQGDILQPTAAIFLDIQGKEQSRIEIQTTISQRNLDVQR